MSEVMQDSETGPSTVYINGDGPDATSSSIIAALQAQLDEANAELRRVQIESETDLNESNSQVLQLQSKLAEQSNLRTQLDTSLKEVEHLKEVLKTRVGSDEECQRKLERLESEKNDLLEVVSDGQKELADLEAESQAKSEELKAFKVKARELESQLSTSRESERTLRLQTQALEANAHLITSDRDFYVKELEETRAASQKFRTDSHQEISRLQTDLDKLKHAHDHLTASHTALQAQHADLQRYHADTLEKNKDLAHRNIEAEASFKKEIDQQKRVVELMDQRDQDRAQREQEIESEWNRRRVELDERERALEEELNRERGRASELEKQLAETKTVLENVCASNSADFDFTDADHHSISNITLGPATPGSPLYRRQAGLALRNGLSPAAAMVSNLQKNGKSLSQLYTDKILLEEQLTKMQAENTRLSHALATILGEIEDKAPIINQQREETLRSQLECDRLTVELTRAMEEKEEVERKCESYLIDLKGLQRDHDLSNRQLYDLSLQIRTLTKELVIRDRGDKSGLMGDENDLMTELDNAPINLEEEAEDLLLSNDLVTYKDITELQLKNLKLLGVTRTLTAKLQELEGDRAMPEDEEENRSAHEAVEEARQLVLDMKANLESSQRKNEALSRERDMLRRMLTQSQQTTYPSELSSAEQVSTSVLGQNRQLDEVTSQFESYKTEMAADSKRINDDLNRTRAELSQSQVSLAKANAQIEYLNERHRNFDQTNLMQTQEIQSLSKTSIKLQEQLVQSESRLHQANENATELQSKCTVLQHQVYTLTTEKEVWKGIEARLAAENTSLIRERNSLSDILSNMQSMKAELDRSSSDSRRRLENQVTKLENRLQDLQDKLKSESESVKQVTLQRDLDNRDYQSRIDRLNTECSTARESLIAAHAKEENLQARVTDLSKQLSLKQDRLQVYEGRSVPVSSTDDGATDVNGNFALSQQQKLEIENSQLKHELVSAKDELVKAKERVMEFKAIAEATEASLVSLSATHDEYKSIQEADLAQKQTTIISLEDRARQLSEDLSTSFKLNRDLQQKIDDLTAKCQSEKVELMTRLASLEDLEARAIARESELRAEGERHRLLADENHNRYQAEVQNHAISLNELRTLKEQLEKARAKITTANTSAETAIAKLQASEASWVEQKVTLEKEIESVTKRCEDLTKQNNLLHEHLESVSAQAAQISNNAINSVAGQLPANDEGVPAPADENNAQSVEQLREIIRYVRNNHSISEQKLSLSKMESTRLQQQLQSNMKELDHIRSELNQERERSRQGYVPSADYAQLLEKINTLNVVRESNATLRDELHRLDRKNKDLENRLQQSNAAQEPLQAELREKRVIAEQYQQEISLLTEDNERWKNRNQQILEKYDRIDPAEVQALRDEITRLKSSLTEQSSQTAHYKENFKTLQGQARDVRMRLLAEKATVETENNLLREEKKKVDIEVQQYQKTVEELRKEKSTLENSLADAIAFEAQVATLQTSLDEAKAETEKQLAAVNGLSHTNGLLRQDNVRFRAENRRLTSEAEQLQATTSQQSAVTIPEELIQAEVSKRLKADQAANPPVSDPSDTTASDEERHQKQLQEARELAIAEKEKAVEEVTQRLTKEREDAITQLKLELSSSNATAPESSENELNALVAEKVAALKAELEAENENKLRERDAQHQLDLKTAVERAKNEAPDQAPTVPLEAVCYTQAQHQESVDRAVEEAKVVQAAELSEAYKIDKDAAIESAKKQGAAEAHSKSNVISVQLKKAHGQVAELKKEKADLESVNADLTRQLGTYTSTSAPATSSTDGVALVSTPASVAVETIATSPASSLAVPVSVASLPDPVPTAPIPSFTGDFTPSGHQDPLKAPQQDKVIFFGKNPPRNRGGSLRGGAGVTRGGRGGLRGAAQSGTSTGSGHSMAAKASLPAEGRMLSKPDAISGIPVKPVSSLAIKGVAKRGGLGGGGGNMLEAAMKAATSGVSTPNEPSTSDGLTGVSSFGKRAREDDVTNIQVGTESGDGNAKRPKAEADITGSSSANVPGELASRLSKRVP
ncbi:hypothetical protein CROQUDRAFT_653921 [Cronartium quercuum f. sp. fusiforme G11]|uniref:Nucleoprotein TPR/MLP1 domain-containing protein n=1 Tax=Cronartium quercuum f. sp. fusiforme G11 TaxID=708437 RepID=A0A9P6NP43_9BASI|nr:hypothetical protein CROQUDRAFT_653921 [Cronartium quercuum f. sp. fusiforme G11]